MFFTSVLSLTLSSENPNSTSSGIIVPFFKSFFLNILYFPVSTGANVFLIAFPFTGSPATYICAANSVITPVSAGPSVSVSITQYGDLLLNNSFILARCFLPVLALSFVFAIFAFSTTVFAPTSAVG